MYQIKQFPSVELANEWLSKNKNIEVIEHQIAVMDDVVVTSILYKGV